MIWKSFFYVDKYRSFWKNLENCGKNIEILNLTTEGKRNYLVLEQITILQSFSQKICWLYK